MNVQVNVNAEMFQINKRSMISNVNNNQEPGKRSDQNGPSKPGSVGPEKTDPARPQTDTDDPSKTDPSRVGPNPGRNTQTVDKTGGKPGRNEDDEDENEDDLDLEEVDTTYEDEDEEMEDKLGDSEKIFPSVH